MQEDNVPGYDAIGFRIGAQEPEKINHLVSQLWAIAQGYPTISGRCGNVAGDYFRLWIHLDGEESSHVLESNPMPGLVGYVESYLAPNLVKAWIWDVNTQDSDTPLYPLCFRTPLPWFLPEDQAIANNVSLAISVLSKTAEFFDTPEQLAQHPNLGKFAIESVTPTGLFVEEGAQPNPGVLVIGKVLLAVQSINEITGNEFHALRVRTLGGEVFVALPLEAISSDVNGKIIAVQGIASGSSPDWTPQPLAPTPDSDESGEPFKFEVAEIEKKLKALCIEFLDSAQFKAYFQDIHVNRFTRVIASFLGAFNSDYIGLTKRRGKATWLTAKKYRRAFKNAPIVVARIVMANTAVLYEGHSSPALVVVAFGEGADEAMDKARSVLARIHFQEPNNPEEKKLAATIADETYQFGKRRKLPSWLVGNVEAYAADLWIPGTAAHDEGLLSEILFCIAEPGAKGLTAALPADLIIKAIAQAKPQP